MVQWWGLGAFRCRGVGSIPGPRTKIPTCHVVGPKSSSSSSSSSSGQFSSASAAEAAWCSGLDCWKVHPCSSWALGGKGPAWGHPAHARFGGLGQRSQADRVSRPRATVFTSEWVFVPILGSEWRLSQYLESPRKRNGKYMWGGRASPPPSPPLLSGVSPPGLPRWRRWPPAHLVQSKAALSLKGLCLCWAGGGN